MTIDALIRKGIANMGAYEGPVMASASCKLDQNESPYDLPAEIKRKIIRRLSATQFNRYNDGSSARLRGLLAVRFRLAPSNIIVGAGIDELLYYIALAFVERGDKVLRFSPSFSMYRICTALANGQDRNIPLNEDFSLPAEFKEQSRNAKLVFICRPNSPTGNAIPLGLLERIAKNSPGLVCIDEAYVDFADRSCLSLLRYENVIILRTFSKAFCAAAVRIGYALADERVVRCLNKVKLPWNLSVFSQIAAEEILLNPKPFEKNAERIKSERSRMFAGLRGLGVAAYPSQANFILFRVPDAASVFESLLEQGVLVRSFPSPQLKNCLRATVGNRAENDRFLEKLGRCLK